MAIFKCKMCGGALEVSEQATVAVCEYCGTKQTLPRLGDEGKANLYDRANHFRRNNEYDKAMSIYEQILNADPEDAEAYWSLVLCRYGIEYVEDPETHKRIPTVNRTQVTSIFADPDYKQALQHADTMQREMYEEEAKAIDQIEKNILDISQKEEPFDVFICYKETDAAGQRTPDSVLANELYHELKEEGLKVFFARITLEDKLGYAYEPYIFAALNSAKVMVVIGTRAEYFNAPWVKNEWSRYLALIKGGAQKMLIPAYKDMDPYDLPEEFAHLQAQDMAKLGFMQDLIRGVKKIAEAEADEEEKPSQAAVSMAAAAAPLLRRAFLFLEDEDFESAHEYCERVLDLEPENAEAYLGKLLAKLKLHKKEELADYKESFSGYPEYEKIVRFGDAQLIGKIEGYNAGIIEREIRLDQEKRYQKALEIMENAKSEEGYREAARILSEFSGYQDADEKVKECLEQAEIARKNAIYNDALQLMSDKSIRYYEAAIREFESIPGWQDADQRISVCYSKIEELKIKEEEERIDRERRKELAHQRELEAAERAKKIKWIKIAAVAVVVLALVLKLILDSSLIQYSRAVRLRGEGNYEEALEKFKELGDYKDTAEQMEFCYLGLYGRDGYKKWEKLTVGDIYRFGSYLQQSNQPEAIEWIILEKEGDELLLISKYALDVQPYHTEQEAVIWKDCSLREWLNTTFLNTAFDERAQEHILETEVVDHVEADTIDKVFLLNAEEIKKYYEAGTLGGTEKTAYTEKLNIYSAGDYVQWWLRTIGKKSSHAATAYGNLSIYEEGENVNRTKIGVRPVVWVKFDPDMCD